MSYFASMFGCNAWQESVIFPGHALQGDREAAIHPAAGDELATLTTSLNDRIVVFFGKAMTHDGAILSDSASRPTILFFYGNATILAYCLDLCQTWRHMGANVLGVEYPGYGLSSGKPSEQAFYAAADAAYDYLLSRNDIDKTKIVPAGLSLGSGVAVDLASRKSVAGLILFAPYTSLDDLGRTLIPWMPTNLILEHHFLSADKIKSLTIPILIIHGKLDTTIPARMSRELAAAATKAKVTTLFVESGHNDLFVSGQPQVDTAIAEFIERANTRQ